MGKLIRNGIEYGGGNGTDIFKVTQSEYDALVQAGTLVHNALYVITDAPNLNAKADDIEYSSGVTVKQAIDSKIQIATFNFTKKINATTQATYFIARTDFNLPSNAVAVSVFLRENIANSVNAGGLVYSAYVNPTANNAVEGAIYNGTNTSRTYSITATLFYTTT